MKYLNQPIGKESVGFRYNFIVRGFPQFVPCKALKVAYLRNFNFGLVPHTVMCLRAGASPSFITGILSSSSRMVTSTLFIPATSPLKTFKPVSQVTLSPILYFDTLVILSPHSSEA